MASFLKTIFTMFAGAGFAAGGFIAATMVPAARDGLGGADLFASAPEPLPMSGQDESFALDQMQALAAGRSDFADGGSAPEASATATNGSLGRIAPGDRGETDSGDSDAFLGDAFDLNRSSASSNAGQPVAPSFENGLTSIAPAIEKPQFGLGNPPVAAATSTPWSQAVGQLISANVDHYSIEPVHGTSEVRCDCWIADGAVRRQLSGTGNTPSEAVVAAVLAVQQYRANASWFSGEGASRPDSARANEPGLFP